MTTGDLKIDLVNGAYSLMRISGLTTQPSPEDVEVAMMRLESMAAEFEGRSICVEYNFEDEPDPNSKSGLDRRYWYAFQSNLAVRLLTDFGKDIAPSLLMGQRLSFSFLSSSTAPRRQIQNPARHPRGSGATLRYNRWQRYYVPQEEAPLSSCAVNKMFIGDVDDFVEHFDSYLRGTEDIASHTIEAGDGLTIVSDSLETPDVNYRIKADGTTSGAGNGNLQLKIVATTSLGRVETRIIIFEVTTVGEV